MNEVDLEEYTIDITLSMNAWHRIESAVEAGRSRIGGEDVGTEYVLSHFDVIVPTSILCADLSFSSEDMNMRLLSFNPRDNTVTLCTYWNRVMTVTLPLGTRSQYSTKLVSVK